MMKIKILSGWSNAGGSTTHHISLTNLLNDNGIDCTFYGPNPWHLDKCKAGMLDDSKVSSNDILISHFINYHKWKNVKFPAKKHILSCHETNLFPLKTINLSQYDVIQYVSESQREWHSVTHPYVIIPPIVEKVKWTDPENNVAGVIGSIDQHKQPHLSIEKALKDGYDKVLLFGMVTDVLYYNQRIEKLVKDNKVILMPYEDNKNIMYGRISKVYHSSIRETYGLVEAECTLAGIPFDGPRNNQIILEKEEILDKWKKVLEITQ